MKVTFISFHNWHTKRLGGFHKFAEACAKNGEDVVFFSFARPYYIFFKNEERLNKTVLKSLIKGVKYKINDDASITNCTWPTLRAPMPLYKFLPRRINSWLNQHSLCPFKSFYNRFLSGTDIFVFESCEGVFLFDRIRRINHNARYIYRPSDPLMVMSASPDLIDAEKLILRNSDKVLIVNEQSLKLYRNRMSDFDESVNYRILPNGVDLEQFELSYPCPQVLKGGGSALYVGARDPEWPLVFRLAEAFPNKKVVIVCPEKCPYPSELSRYNNLIYVPGIMPSEVPSWVTNASIIIIPNPHGRYLEKTWGVTAKYYQAMAAKKIIVAYEDSDELKNYGVYVSHDYDSFISDCEKAFSGVRLSGSDEFDLSMRRWDKIVSDFITELYHI